MSDRPTARGEPASRTEGLLVGAGRPRVLLMQGAILLVALLSMIALIDNGSFANPDEGLYTAQADTLAHGSWQRPRPALDVDSNGDWSALASDSRTATDEIPYSRRPLYPILLTPFWTLGGTAGSMALSVLGASVAALCAGFIGRQLDHRLGAPALWLVGLTTPLIYYTYLAVGHAIACAFSAALALAVTKAVSELERKTPSRRRTWAAAAMSCAATVPLVLLRSEGVILVIAVAGATAIVGMDVRAPLSLRSQSYLGVGGLIAAVGVAAYFLNDLWARGVTAGGGGDGDVTAISRAPDPLHLLWASVLRPWYPDNSFASASMVLVIVGSVTAPLLLRWVPRMRLLALALLVMAATASLIRLLERPSLISGFFATAPWLVAGLLSLSRADLQDRCVRVLLAASVITFVGVLLTSYGEGGGDEWGGRFFLVTIPLMAPVAALGLLHLIARLPKGDSIVVIACTAIVALSLSVAALRENATARAQARTLTEFIVDSSKATDADLVVFSPMRGGGASRKFWRIGSGLDLVAANGIGTLPILLGDVPPNRERVLVVTDAPHPVIASFASKTKGANWTLTGDFDGPGDLLDVFELERK